MEINEGSTRKQWEILLEEVLFTKTFYAESEVEAEEKDSEFRNSIESFNLNGLIEVDEKISQKTRELYREWSSVQREIQIKTNSRTISREPNKEEAPENEVTVDSIMKKYKKLKTIKRSLDAAKRTIKRIYNDNVGEQAMEHQHKILQNAKKLNRILRREQFEWHKENGKQYIDLGFGGEGDRIEIDRNQETEPSFREVVQKVGELLINELAENGRINDSNQYYENLQYVQQGNGWQFETPYDSREKMLYFLYACMTRELEDGNVSEQNKKFIREHFGEVDISNLDTMINSILRPRNESIGNAINRMSLIRNLHEYLVERGYCENNPNIENSIVKNCAEVKRHLPEYIEFLVKKAKELNDKRFHGSPRQPEIQRCALSESNRIPTYDIIDHWAILSGYVYCLNEHPIPSRFGVPRIEPYDSVLEIAQVIERTEPPKHFGNPKTGHLAGEVRKMVEPEGIMRAENVATMEEKAKVVIEKGGDISDDES